MSKKFDMFKGQNIIANTASSHRYTTPSKLPIVIRPAPGESYLSQPVLRGEPKPFPTITRPMDSPRNLEDFQTQKEVLLAVRGALDSLEISWDLFVTPYRFVSPKTIRIRVVRHPGATRHFTTGDLVKPDPDTANPMFKSCIELSTLVLDRADIFPVDYLDDFEALYYSLCWLCINYIGPGSLRPAEFLPKPIWDWAHYPLSKAIAQWKEHQLLYGPGIESEQVSVYFGPPFAVMLRRMREMLRMRHLRKLALCRGRTEREMRMEAVRDFREFKGIVDRAIKEARNFYWERSRANERIWFWDGLDERVFFNPSPTVASDAVFGGTVGVVQ